jgi:hypothetical protein
MDKVFKAPKAELDYGFDWSEWMTDGEIIADVDWIVPDGITQFDDAYSDFIAVIWLNGGTASTSYTITCRMTTNSTPPRIDDRSFIIHVKER